FSDAAIDARPHFLSLKIDAESTEVVPWDGKLNPKTIFIEKSISGRVWTKNFISRFPSADRIEVGSLKAGADRFYDLGKASRYNRRLENIFIIESKDSFIKACPCTKKYRRCGYWILNLGSGCPIDCAYCYLQAYSNAPGIILPANIENYFFRITEFDKKLSRRIRIGTGEFADSLAFDRYTNYSRELIPFFAGTKNLVLELKTKMIDVSNVLKEKPHENVVISWSVNTESAARKYELGGASIGERLAAAACVVKAGYKIGFHFDPIIYYPGWEAEYKGIVEKIFSDNKLNRSIQWVSLGTLRYIPSLKQAAEQRFSDTRLYYSGDFLEDSDGKLRYPRKLRTDIYKKFVEWIRRLNKTAVVYLCMEPDDVWRSASLEPGEY
ncbi:MAG: hypothetical protein HQL28_02335, partial [Candidatus Omnitrophica bacterium]|nr:hypothetical protein [Candidatus Omnitrophota bacterium]